MTKYYKDFCGATASIKEHRDGTATLTVCICGKKTRKTYKNFIYEQLDEEFIDQHGLTDLFKVVNSVPPLKTDYVPRDSIVREFVGGSCFSY